MPLLPGNMGTDVLSAKPLVVLVPTNHSGLKGDTKTFGVSNELLHLQQEKRLPLHLDIHCINFSKLTCMEQQLDSLVSEHSVGLVDQNRQTKVLCW